MYLLGIPPQIPPRKSTDMFQIALYNSCYVLPRLSLFFFSGNSAVSVTYILNNQQVCDSRRTRFSSTTVIVFNLIYTDCAISAIEAQSH